MAKATPADVEVLGFTPKTFYVDPADWDGYLQAILDRLALEVADKVGASTYASTTPITLARVTQIEVLLAGAELMSRAEAVYLRDIGSGEGARFYAESEWMKKRKAYLDEVDVLLARLGVSPWIRSADDIVAGPVIAVSSSSHFATDQEAE